MKPEGRFTLKLMLSYLCLIVLACITGYAIYNEVLAYIGDGEQDQADLQLIRVSELVSRIYEVEAQGGNTLEIEGDEGFEAYRAKVDSIRFDILALKEKSRDTGQFRKLDSIQSLLDLQLANTRQLLDLREEELLAGTTLEDALSEFSKIEESLGQFKAETLFPGFKSLSPQVQQTLTEYASLLSQNAPRLNDANADPAYLDSILSVSRGLLEKARKSQARHQQSRRERLVLVAANNRELSGQLRSLLSSLEQEIWIRGFDESLRRRSALRNSIRLAGAAALLGLLAVVVFTFLIHRDFYRIEAYRRKLEAEKQYSESLLRSREHLINSVSHDIRSPLNTIQGFGELLDQCGLTRQQARYTRAIRSATHYLERLANDLLDFTRLEAGQLEADPGPFIPAQLIRETAESLRAANREAHVSLRMEIGAGLELSFHGDAFRIRQILSNLLSNAYKFTERGEIVVRADIDQSGTNTPELQIEVSDTGIGIREEQLDSIFREFSQADPDKGSRRKGYGLGLWISRKLSELLGGTLEVSSAWGSGSTFTLRLPMSRKSGIEWEPMADSGRGLTKVPATGSSPNSQLLPASVLVIDDDTSLTGLIAEYCRNLGIKCTRYNSYEAIPGSSSLDFDQVLSDLELPGTGGLDGIHQIKSGKYGRYRGQPVIAMTGRRDIDEETLCRAGFSGLLRKPFSAAQLEAVLSGSQDLANPDIPEAPGQNPGSIFRIRTDSLESFLGDDPEAIGKILHTFYAETKANRQFLSEALEHSDPGAVSRIAHRMLPMFRQLGLHPAIPLLERLENIGSEADSALRGTIRDLLSMLDHLLVLLESGPTPSTTAYSG